MGLLLAKAPKAPNQIATIYTLWCWIARYGTLITIESDQGTHFTGAVIQKWANTMYIQWNYHLPYNPTTAGNIERHNGLLKLKLAQLSDTLIHKALEIACFELNSRYKLYRRSPLEDAFPDKVLDNPIETTNKQPILPYKILRKDQNNLLSPQEIICHNQGNVAWTTNGKGTLNLTKLDQLSPQ
jgi:hypothetical protein